MKNYRERSLLDFQKDFATEDACAEHLKEMRWTRGFVCPACRHDKAWYIKTRKVFDCQRCRIRTSLIAGTIFHKTRTPLLKWYWILYHMAMDIQTGRCRSYFNLWNKRNRPNRIKYPIRA